MANILANSHSTTDFYPYVRRLEEAAKHLEVLQLIYYWLCRNNSIIHFIVHEDAHRGGFTVSGLFQSILDANLLPSVSDKNIREGINLSLNSLAMGSDPASRYGLGPLEVVHAPASGSNFYTTHSQPAHPLAAAYIIYSNWPANTAKVAIDEIASARNSIGRIFFLDEIQVMTVLRRLEDRNLVKVETVARINQVGINPRLTPNDILDMLVAEAVQ